MNTNNNTPPNPSAIHVPILSRYHCLHCYRLIPLYKRPSSFCTKVCRIIYRQQHPDYHSPNHPAHTYVMETTRFGHVYTRIGTPSDVMVTTHQP